MVFENDHTYLLCMVIYITTNLITGKIYIGKDSTNNPSYVGSGLLLKKAIKKYGISNFKKEILECCNSHEHLCEREKYWITELKSTDRKIGYNIAEGGTGGDTFSHLSKAKKQNVIKKRESSMCEVRKTKEYLDKLSKRTKDMWMDDTHREKISTMMKGRKIEWSDKISNSIKEWHKTKPISEDSRKRISEKVSKKMKGYEFVKIPETIQSEIIKLYQSYGPKLIANKITETGYPISRYIVTRFLKKSGLYKKWQKGIGDKEQKNSSISRRGKLNPMWKN